MSDDPITLVEYDPEWPQRYRRERENVLGAIGDRVVRIEHVGSTAVPGLAAKPIVDVTATVEDWVTVDRVVEPIESIGYEYVPESAEAEDPWRYFEKRPEDGQAFNLHLRPVGSDHVEKNVLFRDFLRDNPERAREYEQLKREAADAHPDDLQAYSEAKTEFVESVIDDARSEYG